MKTASSLSTATILFLATLGCDQDQQQFDPPRSEKPARLRPEDGNSHSVPASGSPEHHEVRNASDAIDCGILPSENPNLVIEPINTYVNSDGGLTVRLNVTNNRDLDGAISIIESHLTNRDVVPPRPLYEGNIAANKTQVIDVKIDKLEQPETYVGIARTSLVGEVIYSDKIKALSLATTPKPIDLLRWARCRLFGKEA